MNVLLTYQIPGAIVARGTYDNHNGRTLVRPVYSECKVRTTLSDAFCKFSASLFGRPKIDEDYNAYARWSRMSPRERIVWHIINYVRSRDGFHFEFEII